MLAKKCFLVGIFTLLIMSLAVSAQPVHPTTGEPLVIDCLRGTPDAIDGDLSDWNLEAMTPAVLDAAEQLFTGQDSWTGPEDCSGEFYLLWDDENIYMAVVVKDDVLSMNKTGGDIWNADAVEIFFATTNAVAGHDEHYQYGFNANNQKWNWCNMDGAGGVEPDYLQIAASVTADGYICEAAIAYGQMPSLDFSAGNIIGFHAVFDDTDNGDRELQMTWTGLEAHDQSLGFGHMILSDEPAPAPEPEPVLILKLDVGNSHNAEELEEGFTSFTLDDSGSKVDGATIEFGGINAGDARRRGEPAGVPYENIYRDFIFGRQSEAGVGYVSVKLSGLMANKAYSITLYSWDVGSTNTRIADWTANGEPLFTTIHDGSVDPPAAEDDYAYTAAATADAEGVILMEAVPGEGTFADQPFAFINALVVELQRISLFAENFEGLTLGPSIDEGTNQGVAGENVWTDTPPEGWTVDESGIPGIGMDATDGVTEWAGWAFADKAWWIETAEDQDRSLFELGSGIVAVADPDEWDDDERLPIPISADPYDTWLTTPAIDIADAVAGTLELKFDSSWRPEFDDNYHQTANITASFDGGEPVEVMLWESDEASDNFHPYATNETVTVDLDKPEGARKLVLTFGLFDAGNDWWWAIDNIEVRAVVPEPVPVAPGTDGLLAYYALDGDATDSSGNGIDGIITNADTGGLGDGGSVWVDDPERGTVISFNGTADSAYVRAGEIPQMTLTNDFTWAFWAKQKAENTADNDIIFGNRMDENAVDFVPRQFIKFTPTKFEWHMNGNGDDNMEYDDIPADVWLHHAVVKTADQLTYYRNGVKASTGMITQPLDVPQPLFFGGDNEGAEGENWNGLMSDACIYDRALSAGEVMFLADLRATPVDPGTKGLVAFYALDGDSNDSSGNELHGTIVGEPAFVEGQIDMALELDGVDDHVNLGNPPVLDFGTGDFTISAWVNLTTIERATVYAKGGDNSGGIRYTLAMGEANDNRMTLTTDDDSTKRQALGSTVVNDGEWHHVVGMRSGDTALVFVDGDKDGSIDLPEGYDLSGSSQANALIGAITDARDATGATLEKFYTGILDEVAIYDRALSGGEIRYLAGFREEAENLLANGSFEEDEPVLDDPDWLQWCTWNPAEGAGSNAAIVDTDAADGARSLKVEPIGVENWHFIVLYLPIMVDMEKNYTANFWAKADEPRPLTVQMKATDNSINAWGATTFDLTTEWAEYSYTSEVLIDNVKLEILCAGSEVPFLLDLVSVFEAE